MNDSRHDQTGTRLQQAKSEPWQQQWERVKQGSGVGSELIRHEARKQSERAYLAVWRERARD